MTLIIDDRQVCVIVATAAQRVLDKWSEGLIDAPQDDLLSGTAREIEEVIRLALRPCLELWNRAWDL